MKKKPQLNDQLSFDFDKPIGADSGATQKNGGFMSEIKDADSYRWGRTQPKKTPNVLTAAEVMGAQRRGAQPSSRVTTEPVKQKASPVAEAKPVAVVEKKSAPAEMAPVPTAQAQEPSISFAAKMIMQRMKEMENERSAAQEKEVPVKPVINIVEPEKADEKEIKAIVPEFSGAEVKPEAEQKTIVMNIPTQEDEAPAKIYTPQAEKTQEPAKDESGIDSFRKQVVDSFEFDKDKFNEFLGVETPAQADAAALGATAVFSAAATPEIKVEPSVAGATKMMDFDDFGDFEFKEEPQQTKLETIDDYNNVDDADALISDFSSRKRRLLVRSIVSGVITALLLALTFGNIIPFGLTAYYATVLVLLGIGALINISLFSSVVSLFKGKSDTDFAPAFSMIASFVQALVCGFFVTSESLSATSMLAAASMLTVTFNSIGKLYIVKRILLNLDFITNEEYKAATTFISAPESGRIADPSRVGESVIFARHKAIDMTNFISFSLSADPYEADCFKLMVASVAASAVAAIAAVFTVGEAASVLTAFATVAAVFAPITSLLAVGRRLFKICKGLALKGTMLSGYKAAEDISEANVVAVKADELFSDESVRLYNFKMFNDCPIDDAIIIAAALTKEGNSPLAGMFNEIVATNQGKLPKVDSVIYEHKMGLTGWVDNRKTLIGNRMILESHNIPVPPISVDKKIISNGRFPVYLAVDDKIAAIFVVGYTANKDVLYSVRRLINTGVTLLVDTSDPNVTEKLVAEKYGIPDDTVVVMSADSARRFREQTQPVEKEAARMIAQTFKGFVDGYTSAYNFRQNASLISLITVIMVCLGAALAIVMPALGMGGFVNVTSVIALYALNYIFTFITSLFNK